MSRGTGTGGGVWYDGYGFHGPGHASDPRHTHAAIHPKFRSAREDMNKGTFGWTSTYNATPMDPSARRVQSAARSGRVAGTSATQPSIRSTGGSSSSSGAGTSTSSDSSERLLVQLIKYTGAWVSRQVGSGEEGEEVFFVRQSSMRNKGDWGKLTEGCHISIAIKRAAGRGIVTDAVLESRGT